MNGYAKYVALQPQYNLVERLHYEHDYAPLVNKFGFSVFPYWSLAAGFLTGKYRSEADLQKSVRGKGVKKYLNEKGLTVLAALDEVSQKHNTKPAAISLAWLLAQPTISAPIVSATSIKQLEVIISAVSLQLDKDDLLKLNIASS